MANRQESSTTRSKGYRVLHNILCVIAALFLFFCMGNTAALRFYISSDALTDQLCASRLSDAKPPFSGKTVSDIVMNGYITDENILHEDVEIAVDSMGIPAFLADKIGAHIAMLRKDSDTPVQITPEEIGGKLDEISDSLYETCRLVIEESDRVQLQAALESPLSVFNSVSSAFGSSVAGRAFTRFGVSFGAYILEIILLLLLIYRWRNIRKSCGQDTEGTFRALGITLLIPSVITLLLVLIGGIGSLFIRDGVIGLYPVAKVIRAPYWPISLTGVTAAIFLLELSAYLREKAKTPKAAASAVRQTAAAPAVQTENATKFCIRCGKRIKADTRFCIYCGADTTGGSMPTESPASTPPPADVPVDVPAEVQTNVPADIPAEVQTDAPADVPADIQTAAQTDVQVDAAAEISAASDTDINSENQTEEA